MEPNNNQGDDKAIPNDGYTMRMILALLYSSSFATLLVLLAFIFYKRYGCFGRRADPEITIDAIPLDTLHPAPSDNSLWSNSTIATAGITPAMDHSVTVAVVDGEPRVVNFH